MEPTPHLRKLVQSLIESTKARRIRWRTVGEPDWYAYRANSGSVLVGTVYNDGRFPRAIRVLDQNGIEVAKAREEQDAEWPELATLYELAKDGEVRFAGVIDGIIAELEKVPA